MNLWAETLSPNKKKILLNCESTGSEIKKLGSRIYSVCSKMGKPSTLLCDIVKQYEVLSSEEAISRYEKGPAMQEEIIIYGNKLKISEAESRWSKLNFPYYQIATYKDHQRINCTTATIDGIYSLFEGNQYDESYRKVRATFVHPVSLFWFFGKFKNQEIKDVQQVNSITEKAVEEYKRDYLGLVEFGQKPTDAQVQEILPLDPEKYRHSYNYITCKYDLSKSPNELLNLVIEYAKQMH